MDLRVVLFLIGICLGLPANTIAQDAIQPLDPDSVDRFLQAPRPAESALIIDNLGAVYTHWGKSICSEQATLVYSGFVGGTWYASKGGSSTYLCMPMEPEYSLFIKKKQSRTVLQSSELQTPSKQIPAFGDLYQNTPACAVCQAFRRPAQFMFPARMTCPDGWTKEYDGYLMTANNRHRRTEYLCVDGQPEAVPNTSKNVNGALLYFVETNSKTHVPSTYTPERELTCSVCTK